MADKQSTEVYVTANPKHQGIVDLKPTGKNERGVTTANGITWKLS